MNLSIVGGSGAGRSLIHLCQRLGFSIDCIYDNRLLVQSKIDGIPCVGNFQSIAFQSTDLFSTCIGSVNSIHRRDKMISALGIPYSQFPLQNQLLLYLNHRLKFWQNHTLTSFSSVIIVMYRFLYF